MPSPLPAICDACEKFFMVTQGFEFGGTTSVTISDVAVGPCPHCRGRGHLLDGRYKFVEGAERATATLSPGVRMRLLAALERAGELGDRSAAEGALESAGLAEFAMRYLVPSDAGEFWQMVGVLSALLIWYSSTH